MVRSRMMLEPGEIMNRVCTNKKKITDHPLSPKFTTSNIRLTYFWAPWNTYTKFGKICRGRAFIKLLLHLLPQQNIALQQSIRTANSNPEPITSHPVPNGQIQELGMMPFFYKHVNVCDTLFDSILQ